MYTLYLEIVKMKYRLVNLTIRNENLLTRQIKSVSVILVKPLGNANTTKLRAIFLLEADFNTLHEIVFNSRLIIELEAKEEIRYEIIGGMRT